MKTWLSCGAPAALAIAGSVALAGAQAASGVTPKLLARGTYEEFRVKSKTDLVDFDVKAKTRTDVVVRQHDYAIGGSTGWHMHPGPVFITVTSGTLTFYELDDPTCTPHIVEAGEGYVDSGQGHIARNESGALATDVSVIIAPVGLPFRTDLPPMANAACPF